MKVIAISGTPGTGKTTLAKRLSKKTKYLYIDVNRIIRKYNISEKYDRRRKCKIVDVRKLNKKLIGVINQYKKLSLKNKRENYKSIFSSLVKFKKNFKFYKQSINKKSLKCQKSKISEHAQKPKVFDKIKNKINGLIIDSHLCHYLPKKYVDLCIITKCKLSVLKNRLKKKKYSEEKIRENLDCEIFDVCLNEAEENRHNIMTIDTTKGININSVLARIK